jgi:hypothetical protein
MDGMHCPGPGQTHNIQKTAGYTVPVWVVDRSPESQGEYEIIIISESYYILSPTTIFIKQDYTNRSDHLEIERRKLV